MTATLIPTRLSFLDNADGSDEHTEYMDRLIAADPELALDFSPLATEDFLDLAENAAAPRCNVLTGCRDLLALGVFGCVYLVLAAGVLIVAVGVAVAARVWGGGK